jgi:pimeloyl-ACP methyl ester carboxylesterase
MQRRTFMGAAAAAPLAIAANSKVARSQVADKKTYVLVHGTWCGGWFFGPLAENLRRQGHRVFTPTQTGAGERKHLLSPEITLETFILDVMNVIEAEELTDVILAGHSSAGPSITGVADRMPDRLRHVVYLDAVLAQSGQSFLDSWPSDAAEARRKAAREINGVRVLPVPSPAPPKAGAPEDPVMAWFQRRLTPYPFAPFEMPLALTNPIGNGRPCTYIAFTKSPNPGLEKSRQFARSQRNWQWADLPQNHGAPAIAPGEVATALQAIG